ncbi:hypothetical protein BOTBODRAFT_30638 [Botryobasidium botryosum FD-172 SS1]|uniref:G domain-containing protein n=1 Tax=Botryobasidium botryosum (strain FD-172 SS1) TaxID=930990 RepID=A0A067MXV5_BOTB1|nr:hypothetical protein BOTBODRAFT_30638 [Botryobasidium botryosum FD-172 SS1]
MEEAAQLRSKYQHFRVLIMGRANAGKTTILKAVCGTREAPQVYNQRGRRIRAKQSILSPTSWRGIHNIEYELRFRSNPGFVFHDSRGFEAGATEELDKVRDFINKRAAERSVDKQLHAIWFCIPTDQEARMLTAAELDFFQRCDTGKVPVIVIFTKFDSLDSKAYQELRYDGLKHSEAQERASRRADEDFKRDHLSRILEQKYPPKGDLCVRNMHEAAGHEEVIKQTVAELLKKTSDSLDTDALKLLLATVQSNNVELCMTNLVNNGHITASAQEALESGVFLPGKNFDQFIWHVGVSYPYLWVNLESRGNTYTWIENKAFSSRSLWSKSQLLDNIATNLAAYLPILNQGLPPHLQVLHLGASAAICCGVLCWKRVGIIGADDFQRMFEHYENSGAGARVRAALRKAFDDVGPHNTMDGSAKLLQIILDHKDIGM